MVGGPQLWSGTTSGDLGGLWPLCLSQVLRRRLLSSPCGALPASPTSPRGDSLDVTQRVTGCSRTERTTLGMWALGQRLAPKRHAQVGGRGKRGGRRWSGVGEGRGSRRGSGLVHL